MADDEKPLVRVDIGSPISFKTEVKTEIPKESSGRLLDALTDIIRPFTEVRGLRADVIRLQREDVLIKIAAKVRERAAIEGGELHPIPNKFLVPFLEKASLEDIASPLIDVWANLLHSASREYDATMVRFSSVLAEVGAKEVEFLERTVTACRSWHPVTQMDDIQIVFTPTQLKSSFRQIARSGLDRDGAIAEFIAQDEYPGALFALISVSEETSEGTSNLVLEHPDITLSDETAIAVLSSLGVILRDTIRFEEGPWDIWIEPIWLTSFGIKLVTACSRYVQAKVQEIEDIAAGKLPARPTSLRHAWYDDRGLERVLEPLKEEILPSPAGDFASGDDTVG